MCGGLRLVPAYPVTRNGYGGGFQIRQKPAIWTADENSVAATAADSLHRSIIALNRDGPASTSVTNFAFAKLAPLTIAVLAIAWLADPHAAYSGNVDADALRH
jgi:hypothetical protein